MKLSVYLSALLLKVLPSVGLALRPLVAYEVNHNGPKVARGSNLEIFSSLEERLPTIHLGTFPMVRTLPANDVIVSA